MGSCPPLRIRAVCAVSGGFLVSLRSENELHYESQRIHSPQEGRPFMMSRVKSRLCATLAHLIFYNE